jgi:ribonucleases P/MRP protein subunit RPP40
MNKIDYFAATVYLLRPDVVAITESWTMDEIGDAEINLMGYVVFRCDRPVKARGGGVLLYVKEELKPVKVELSSRYPEHVWCCIKSEENHNELLLGVVYRTPNETIYGSEAHGQLLDVISEVGKSRNVLIFGDFNYGNIDWESHRSTDGLSEGERFLSCVEDAGLYQHVKNPTRGSSLLDLIFSSNEELIDEVDNLGKFDSSDHDMLFCRVNWGRSDNACTRTRHNYNKINIRGITQELDSVEWKNLLEDPVEVSWRNFKNKLLELEQKYVPLQKNVKKNKEPWLTYKSLKMIRKKHRAYSRYKDSSHPACKRISKEVKLELRKAKRNFETKLSENIKADKKSFFSYVRHKSRVNVKPNVLLDSGGDRIENNHEIAEKFNTYFSSVFTNETDRASVMNHTLPRRTAHSMSPFEITEDIVRRKLEKLRADKSPGPDKLSPRLLCAVRDRLVAPITELIKKSLSEGKVPEDWRKANITVIHKKGSRLKTCNYRPISLTSQLCKIMESVVRDALVEYLEKHELLNPSQHGFRKKRSCVSNMLVFLDRVTQAVDEGCPVDVAYLDFAKAFDVVPHARLIQKMESYGIDRAVLLWIADWLSDRVQRVSVSGEESGWTAVTSGVPQGSVLGPVLFLIFINDIDDGLRNLLLKFADDTKIACRARDDLDRKSLQEDLDKLVEWSETWCMRFNFDKCKIMHFGNGNACIEYTMAGNKLESVKEERDLGILMSSDLKPSKHCTQAYGKANRMSSLIKRTIVNKSPQIMIRLYKCLVRPHLEYGMSIWSPWYKKDRDLIERVQRRFTKMIHGMHDMEYTDRLRHLNLWTLEERRNRNDLIEVYNIIRGRSAIPSESFFEICRDKRTRGHQFTLYKKSCNKDVRLHFFSNRVINRWNDLSERAVNAPSINAFKNELDNIRRKKMGFFMDH